MSGVDWLRDEPLIRLSAITTVPGLGLTFIGPHCAVRCVTFPLSWDKPVTASPDGQQPGHPLPPLSLSSARSLPVPKHWRTTARPQPLIRAPVRPSFQAVVMLLCRLLTQRASSSLFDCDASVSHRMFAIFVAQQVTRCHSLRCRLMECPCGETPFCRGASDLVL